MAKLRSGPGSEKPTHLYASVVWRKLDSLWNCEDLSPNKEVRELDKHRERRELFSTNTQRNKHGHAVQVSQPEDRRVGVKEVRGTFLWQSDEDDITAQP